MMREKRVPSVDWSKHTLTTTKSENFTLYSFQEGTSYNGWIKFINTNGILAISGDYGNWIFCREFHPSPKNYVSDGYWVEKLKSGSCQIPSSFDFDETKKEIQAILDAGEDEGVILNGDQIEFLEECIDLLGDGHHEYEYLDFAYSNKNSLWHDYEFIPQVKELNIWLRIIFDAFDEICKRMGVEGNFMINPFNNTNQKSLNDIEATVLNKTYNKSLKL